MLYNLLQDGGRAVNPYIAAEDKDINPIFAKLCSLTTIDLFNFMENVKEVPAAIASSLPSQSERKKIESVFDTIREDLWLDEVYGP